MENFNKLPDEMKAVSVRLSNANRRVKKAFKQFSLWEKELEISEAEYRNAETEYGQASLRWDVETNSMKQIELEDFNATKPA